MRLKVTAFLLTGVGLIIALILMFSKITTLFQPTYQIYLITKNIGEIEPGANVMMRGLVIGKVVDINLEPDLRSARLRLKISKYYPVKKDSIFTIEQQGMLGKQYVGIYPNTDRGEFLSDNDVVYCREQITFFDAGRLASGMWDRLRLCYYNASNIYHRVDNFISSNIKPELEVISSNFSKISADGDSVASNVNQIMNLNTSQWNLIGDNYIQITNATISFINDFENLTNYIASFVDKAAPLVDNLGNNIEILESQWVNITKGIQNETATNRVTKLKETLANISRSLEKTKEAFNNINQKGLLKGLKND